MLRLLCRRGYILTGSPKKIILHIKIRHTEIVHQLPWWASILIFLVKNGHRLCLLKLRKGVIIKNMNWVNF